MWAVTPKNTISPIEFSVTRWRWMSDRFHVWRGGIFWTLFVPIRKHTIYLIVQHPHVKLSNFYVHELLKSALDHDMNPVVAAVFCAQLQYLTGCLVKKGASVNSVYWWLRTEQYPKRDWLHISVNIVGEVRALLRSFRTGFHATSVK